MTHSMPPQSEVARAAEAAERPLEDLIEQVPVELLMAEPSHAEVLDDVERDFWADPCHFLRCACQAADYGGDERRA